MSDTELIGNVIASQFRILKKLGSGGMGSVFLAEQIEMERKVVVKVLHAELSAQNPVVLERFRREAKAVAQLNHPNIVQVFVFGTAENGQMYLAMEYIDGRDLGQELGHGPLAQTRSLKILDQACAALIEAHGAGIVHRDLKPENIMLTDRHGNPDYVKVLDFGIAKLHDSGDSGSPALTQAGTVFGTPRYMSPEQVRGEPVDARSDIYALGIILYEMLCGRHPFEAVTTIDYLMKHVNEPVPLPSVEFGELEIQPRIENILLKCLEKSSADRYQSVAELQRDVRVALRDFSEAVRGFPSNSIATPAPKLAATPRNGPRNEKTGKAGASTYHPPEQGRRKGMPAWVWAVVGLVLVGGIVGVVLAIGPKSGGTGQGGGERSALLGAEGEAGEGTTVGGGDEGEDDGLLTAKNDREGRAAEAGDDPVEEGDEGDEGEPADGPAPKTTIAVGESIDGFPLPSDATIVTSSPQTEMYETANAPRDVLQFYRAKLHGEFKLKDMPNGLMIEDQDSPFSFITLSANGDRWYLILQRNALAPASAKPAGPMPAAFGVEFPPDASLIMRSDQAVVARSRLGFAAVCEFYETKYGSIQGMMVMKDLEAETPYCTVAASMVEGSEWMAVAVVNDPMSKGAVMISVARRM
jgi:serine/threonine protein kinase